MPQIQSRVNGIIVNIPPDAAGVVGRFATKGGNELVFEQPTNQRHAPAGKRNKGGDDGTTMKISTAGKKAKKQDESLT